MGNGEVKARDNTWRLPTTIHGCLIIHNQDLVELRFGISVQNLTHPIHLNNETSRHAMSV